jgi:hypothetical protein
VAPGLRFERRTGLLDRDINVDGVRRLTSVLLFFLVPGRARQSDADFSADFYPLCIIFFLEIVFCSFYQAAWLVNQNYVHLRRVWRVNGTVGVREMAKTYISAN